MSDLAPSAARYVAIAGAIIFAAAAANCTAVSFEDAVAGKPCGPGGACLASYVCSPQNICVPAGSGGDAGTGSGNHGGDGGTAGGGAVGAGGVGAAGGDGGGGSSAVTVECIDAPNICDITAGNVCCLSRASATGTCTDNSCDPNQQIPVWCDGPEDCPGEICCAVRSAGETTVLECRQDCVDNSNPVCDPDGPDPCTSPETCQSAPALNHAYGVCKIW